MPPPVLWQFRFSHYNEKARWALDWKGVQHTRSSLLPGWHFPQILWMTGQKALPVLVLDGKPIADSTEIIAALEAYRPDPPLYPAGEAERRRALELEDYFDEELGPHIRRAFFHILLEHTDYVVACLTLGAGDTTRRVYRAMFPFTRLLMKVDMGIDDAAAARSWAKVDAALDRLEGELRPSGYLVGDSFTVADLTAAALFSPLLLPPEFPYQPPGPLPREAEEMRARFAGRRAVQWIADMYRRHRGSSAEVSSAAAA